MKSVRAAFILEGSKITLPIKGKTLLVTKFFAFFSQKDSFILQDDILTN